MAQETQTGALYQPRGVGFGEGDGTEVQKGGDICILMGDWPASWETYMHVRKQQLELDMEQQTGSK